MGLFSPRHGASSGWDRATVEDIDNTVCSNVPAPARACSDKVTPYFRYCLFETRSENCDTSNCFHHSIWEFRVIEEVEGREGT